METDIEKAKKLDVKEIAERFGISFVDGKCLCFMHHEKTPSMSIYKNKLKCFGCGASLSSIDVYMYFTGETDIIKASKQLLGSESFKANIKKVSAPKVDEKAYKKKMYDDKKQQLIYKESKTIADFFAGRGLLHAKENLDQNGIGIHLDKFGQICFVSEKHQWIQCRGHDRKKYNYGSPPILYLQAIQSIQKNSEAWFICEGLTDSLTALEMGYNTICLNSLSNLNKFINEVDKNLKFVIALDNDSTADKYIYRLIDYFASNKIVFDVFEKLYDSNFKDLSNFFCSNNGGGVKIEKRNKL